MARIIQSATTPISNRRHGVVFATQAGNPTLRHGSIPVQPKTVLQNVAQTNFSSTAAFWYSLTPSQQAYWNALAPSGSSGYAQCVAYQQLLATWGCNFQPEAVSAGNIDGGGVFALGNTPSTTGCFLRVYAPGWVGPSNELWLRFYLQASALTPVSFSGNAGGPPLVPSPQPYIKPSGYLYAGSFGPCIPSAAQTFDITDLIYGLFGQQPTPVTELSPSLLFYGSNYDIGAYWTDQYGQICNPLGGNPFPEYTKGGWFAAPPF
jgi:hypothetical protein